MWHGRMMMAAAAWGMSLWQEALLFGLISAASLPIGAMLGIWQSPVSDRVVAAIVAFGAGALLFAVTVELYGHALHEVALGALGYTEMFTTVGCALLGALMYLYLNDMMEAWMEGEEEEGHDEPRSAGASPQPKAAPKAEPKAGPPGGSRWDSVRRHASVVGGEAVRAKRKTLTAKEAIAAFLSKTTPEHHAKMKAVRGRKKRMLLAYGGTQQHVTYGSIEAARAEGEETEEDRERRVEAGMRLAYAMFLGLVVDGVPESILLGFLAAENSLSLVLVLSLFVANFPEAFSSASLMKEAEVPTIKIVGMWGALCVLTGVLAALACAALLWLAGDAAATGKMPFHISMTIAVVEGIAGGAMIACIASVMLPEAFGRRDKTSILMNSGFLCTAGFLCAVVIKVVGGVVTSERLEHSGDEVKGHADHAHAHHSEISSLHGFGGMEQTLGSMFVSALDHFFHSQDGY